MGTLEDTAITAVVLTHNSERVLLPCLQSLQFCTRTLVIDAGSTDSTIRIAKACGATVIHKEWEGYQKQYAFALAQVQTMWTLVIDSDEICSEALQHSIQAIVQSTQSYNVFLLSRCTWYLDRFLRHGRWYPEYIARFFRTGYVSMTTNSGGHIEFTTKEQMKKLDGDILHYSYASYFDELQKLNRYAQNGAIALLERGRSVGIFSAIFHSIGRFFVQYILHLGFLDGKAGFILSVHEAFYVFCKYIRVSEGTWGAPYTQIKKGRD